MKKHKAKKALWVFLAALLAAAYLPCMADEKSSGKNSDIAFQLKLNEGKGVPKDSSPSPAKLKSFKAKWTKGREKGKFALDFSKDAKGASLVYLDNKSLNIGTTPFTIEMWVYPRLGEEKSKDGNKRVTLISKQSNWQKGFLMIIINDGLQFQVFKNKEKWKCWGTGIDLTQYKNKWIHLAGVFDPAKKILAIYVNGKLKKINREVDGIGASGNSPLLIGGFARGWTFDGKIGKIIITKRAKDVLEIRKDAETDKGAKDVLNNL